MAEKGLYKKAVDSWSDDVKFSARAKENKMFENNQSEKVGARKKSIKKGAPRSNHKHAYKAVIVWRKSCFSGKISYFVGGRCSICGKMERRYYSLFGGESEKTYLGGLAHFFEENDKYTPIDSKTYQKTIFLGGSKIINRLDDRIKEDLIDYMNLGYKILIGDSLGADKEMQKLLAKNGYPFVTVYYSGDRPRVNLGNFKTKHLSSNKYLSDYERQKLKDNQMATDCDYGYMLLQGQTKGTMANVNKLLKQNKPCYVIMHDKNGVYARNAIIKKEDDLRHIDWYYEKFN